MRHIQHEKYKTFPISVILFTYEMINACALGSYLQFSFTQKNFEWKIKEEMEDERKVKETESFYLLFPQADLKRTYTEKSFFKKYVGCA